MKSAISKAGFKSNLQTRLMLAFAFVVLIQAAITGSITHNYIQVILEDRIGDQALQLSKVVSSLPQIRDGLENRDVNQVQPLAELLRKQTDARFIVVGDTDGIRFSHPLPERIGQKRVGGDNQRALEKGEAWGRPFGVSLRFLMSREKLSVSPVLAICWTAWSKPFGVTSNPPCWLFWFRCLSVWSWGYS